MKTFIGWVTLLGVLAMIIAPAFAGGCTRCDKGNPAQCRPC